LGDAPTQVAEESTRGSFFLTIGGLTSTIISAIGVFIVTYLLGPELYGVYTLSFTVPSIFLTLINLGINQGLTKYSASLHGKKEDRRLAKLVRHGIIFNVLIGLIFFVVCLALADFFATYLIARPEYGGYVRFASTIIFFQTVANSANAVFVGFYRTEFSALNAIISAIVKISIAPLLIIAGFGVLGALIGLVASYLASAIFGIIVVEFKLHKTLDKSGEASSFLDDVKMLLKYGFPLFAGTIVSGFYSQFQSIMLANFTSTIEVGFFQAAQNFATFIRVISGSVTTAIFPAFARLDNELNRLKTFFSLCVKYSSLILLPLVLLIMVFPNEIVSIVYRSAYVSTPSYLFLIMIEFLFVGMGSIVLGSFFNGIGETKINFRTSLVNFAIFLPSAFLLTRPYAVYGLIASYLMASFASTVYGAFVAKRRFNVASPWRVMAKIYTASLISLLAVFVFETTVPLNVFLRLFIGALIFVLLFMTLLPVLGIVSRQELIGLERAVSRTKALALVVKVFFFYERTVLGILEKKQTAK
jgi:O-antigen/teichoic acid export membrane protein